MSAIPPQTPGPGEAAIGDIIEDETPLPFSSTPRLATNVEFGSKRGHGATPPGVVFRNRGHRPGSWRESLTNRLLWLTGALTVLALALALWVPNDIWTRLQAQLGFLLTPFHTLLGIAVGYYFAADRAARKGDDTHPE